MNKKIKMKPCALLAVACLLLANFVQVPVVRATEDVSQADIIQSETTEDVASTDTTVSDTVQNDSLAEDGAEDVTDLMISEEPETTVDDSMEEADVADSSAISEDEIDTSVESSKDVSGSGNELEALKKVTTTNPIANVEDTDTEETEDITDAEEPEVTEEPQITEEPEADDTIQEAAVEGVKTGDNSFKDLVIWAFLTLASTAILIGAIAIACKRRRI